MKIRIYKDVYDNGVGALHNLVRLLKIKVTNTSIEKIKLNPDYPSITSISEALKEWNIDSLLTKLSSTQLATIPLPAIAHLKMFDGYLVVLEKFDKENIHYTDPGVGLKIEPINEFCKKWSGVVLLVQLNENAGEKSFDNKRRVEIYKLFCKYLTYFLFGTILISSFLIIPYNIFPQLLVCIVGLGFNILLIQKQFGKDNSFTDSFCKISSKSDCETVINSSISTFLGVIHLSELGAIYFIGKFLTLVFSAISNREIYFSFYMLNFLILPLTFYLFYYQWRVIKKWCPLCIATVLMLWLDTIIIINRKPSSISIMELYNLFLGFSIPLTFWLLFNQKIKESFRAIDLERRLLRFTRSKIVFNSLWYIQEPIDNVEFLNEIEIGNRLSSVKVILVSNPVCEPCIYAHKIIEELIECFGNKLMVIYRFSIPEDSNSVVSAQMVRHLISISLMCLQSDISKALSSWYDGRRKKDILHWINENPLPRNNQKDFEIDVTEHSNWCKKVGIRETPTIFINGRRVPQEFSLNEIKHQISNILAEY